MSPLDGEPAAGIDCYESRYRCVAEGQLFVAGASVSEVIAAYGTRSTVALQLKGRGLSPHFGQPFPETRVVVVRIIPSARVVANKANRNNLTRAADVPNMVTSGD